MEKPQLAFETLFGEDDDPHIGSARIDLDKAWQAIHYLLTGNPFHGDRPLNALLVSDHDLSDPDGDWTYGTPWFHRAPEVVAFDEALRSVSDDELRERFDPADMSNRKIYPGSWDQGEIDYVMENVALLRKFVSAAAAQSKGLLIGVN